MSPVDGALLGAPFEEMELEGKHVVIQGTSGGTIGVEPGTRRIVMDGCRDTDLYTSVATEVWVSNCVNCKVHTICDSLLIYASVDCEMHVYVTCPPIMERSHGIALSPWSQTIEHHMMTPALMASVNHYDRPFDLSKAGLTTSPTSLLSVTSAKIAGRLHYHIVPPGPEDVSPLLRGTYPKVGPLEEASEARVIIREVQCKKEEPEEAAAEEAAEETAVPVPAKPTGEAVFQRARREALAGVNARGPWDVAGEALVPKAKWDKSEVTATSASYFRGKTVVIGESELKRDQQVCYCFVYSVCNKQTN